MLASQQLPRGACMWPAWTHKPQMEAQSWSLEVSQLAGQGLRLLAVRRITAAQHRGPPAAEASADAAAAGGGIRQPGHVQQGLPWPALLALEPQMYAQPYCLEGSQLADQRPRLLAVWRYRDSQHCGPPAAEAAARGGGLPARAWAAGSPMALTKGVTLMGFSGLPCAAWGQTINRQRGCWGL